MLSDNTIAIVKSTAPVLEQGGEELTKHFYKRMFAQNPEVAPLFNPANQFVGSQQRALAAAICAYAANIDNLDVLGGAVELIAQKHASLRIKPEHYSIVGENLLASIREVLGEAATDDVINAWGEAYQFLAGILIGRETQIYKEQATAPGGWKEFKKFRVARKQKENAIVTSFYLEPAEPSPLPSYKPGQYLTVRVPSPDGLTTMRNYSLSDRPGLDHLRISVKRETGPKASTPKGYVSNLLHDKIDVGSTIDIAPPCGEFFLDVNENHDRPLVLLAGGIGITPLYAILRTALSATPERKVVLIYGSLNQDIQTFRDDIAELAAKHKNLAIHFRYSEPKYAAQKRHPASDTGMIDVALVEKLVPEKDADYYFCGPKPFMVNMYHQLLAWGIPASQVHFEFFGPRQELEELAAA